MNFISNNYGHAGEVFTERIAKETKLQELFKVYFNDIMDNADTTEKQAMTMALMQMGDMFASLYFFDDGELKTDEIKQFLTSAKDVDVSERAYEFTMNLIALNQNKFGVSDVGEIWGKEDGNHILINKDVLIKELRKEGFEYESIKNKWDEKRIYRKE